MSAKRGVWADIFTQLCLSRLFADGEAADRGHDAQWERDPRYCPRPTCWVQYRAARIKKKPPGCPRSTPASWRGVVRRRSRSKCGASKPLRSMRCGVSCKAKPTSAGCGMPLIILSGVVLAYVFGSRADRVFVELQKLLKPCGLEHVYTDGAGVYARHLPAAAHTLAGHISLPRSL